MLALSLPFSNRNYSKINPSRSHFGFRIPSSSPRVRAGRLRAAIHRGSRDGAASGKHSFQSIASCNFTSITYDFVRSQFSIQIRISSLFYISVCEVIDCPDPPEHGDARRHAVPVPRVFQQRPGHVQQPRAHVHPPGELLSSPSKQFFSHNLIEIVIYRMSAKFSAFWNAYVCISF